MVSEHLECGGCSTEELNFKCDLLNSNQNSQMCLVATLVRAAQCDRGKEDRTPGPPGRTDVLGDG
jgi:hypothetical protein